jgi:hypothetical protein
LDSPVHGTRQHLPRLPRLHLLSGAQRESEMIRRLDELERYLLTRRQRAETERWRGEIEGIDLTLTFLYAKREQAQRLSQRPLLQIRTSAPTDTEPP